MVPWRWQSKGHSGGQRGVEVLAVVPAAEAVGGRGGGRGDRTGHGGRCRGSSRQDPAVPGAISPLPRGLVPLHWVGSLSAESEGHWG